MPESLIREWRDRVNAAATAGAPLWIRGSGSKDFLAPPDAQLPRLDTCELQGVLDYDPSELVLSARAGTPMRQIEALLDAQGQQLACEPPHYGPAATLGGCVASGLAGPGRLAAGPLRDSVLGVRLLDGHGRDLRFGGRVMKNVAGYDLARVMVGARGTLGVLLEVVLKLQPCPAAECTLRFELEEAAATRQVNAWLGQPWPITASAWYAGELRLRLAGSRAAVERGRRELGGEPLPEAQARADWRALREQQWPGFDLHPAAASLWRVVLPATAPPLPQAEDTLVEWAGGLRWVVARDGRALQAAAQAAGGHARAFRGPAVGDPAAAAPPRAPAMQAIERRLRAVFDPAGIFAHGAW